MSLSTLAVELVVNDPGVIALARGYQLNILRDRPSMNRVC
jgi:hypothetical protein